MVSEKGNTILFGKVFYNSEIEEAEKLLQKIRKRSRDTVVLDLSETRSAGTLSIARILELGKDKNIDLVLSVEIKERLRDFEESISYSVDDPYDISVVEKLVNLTSDLVKQSKDFIVLAADIFYYSIRSVFKWKGRKKGSVFEQMLLMGNNAIPIVFLLSFLIGLILSLQSAAQLRQFGANIYLVDLIVIAMITEMGPMITAVIVAGRSGSAIAAEISTMKITEELDALKVMALNPLKYVVAPKMLAMTVSLPVLTILANLVGILGGFIIAVIYLDLSVVIFFNRAVEVMTIPFWRQSVLKSVLFSWLIVIIGAHFGFNVKGGAEGVGRATTASVVASIFAVIITDALLSIIFYFEF
ncbi:MAG: ABC transporter permease [Candidatus Delongbacteria bacterium]